MNLEPGAEGTGATDDDPFAYLYIKYDKNTFLGTLWFSGIGFGTKIRNVRGAATLPPPNRRPAGLLFGTSVKIPGGGFSIRGGGLLFGSGASKKNCLRAFGAGGKKSTKMVHICAKYVKKRANLSKVARICRFLANFYHSASLKTFRGRYRLSPFWGGSSIWVRKMTTKKFCAFGARGT